jgi:5-formyltetrahydrofolate cyclo-ligase
MPTAEVAPLHLLMKRALRTQAQMARRAASALLGPGAGDAIARNFMASVPWSVGRIVAGYWPLPDEADVRPLLARLAGEGCITALPAVIEPNVPLKFRQWAPGDALEAGPYGTRHPLAKAPPATPDLLLLPLLAFDGGGNRLGYGAGYFDRTIAALRRVRPLLAVGIAFAAQQMPAVPVEAHDQPLDWIVTEQGARHFDHGSGGD